MDLRPDLNDPVVLRDAADHEYASRVEDLGPGVITVARPLEVAPDEHAVDAAVLVTWASSRGVVVLPTRLVQAHAEGGVPLWSLAVTGKASVEQQRQFVRVPAAGPVLLQVRPPGSEPSTVTGRLVDVSEAALRCTVARPSVEELGVDPLEVVAGFRLGDRDFAIPAHTEMRRPSAHPAAVVELVVVFDEPVRDADALRKQIYAQQLRALRARDGDR